MRRVDSYATTYSRLITSISKLNVDKAVKLPILSRIVLPGLTFNEKGEHFRFGSLHWPASVPGSLQANALPCMRTDWNTTSIENH